ncbi:MAG: Wzz/FepE/Etk N-terminal domain-containing protein, partial [Rhodospirillaceae bacterium]
MNAIREPQSLSTPPQPPEQRGDFQRLREDLLSQIEPLWRRRRLIIGLVTLSMIIGVILVGRITPQYTASAQVIVEGANTRVINLQEVVEGMRPHRGVVLGQLEILRSTKLADRVIERLQLADSGVFNPRLRPPAPLFSSLNPMALAKDLVRAVVPQSWIDALKGSLSSEAEEVPEENPELQRQIREERLTQQIRNAYRAGLSVRQIGFSN